MSLKPLEAERRKQTSCCFLLYEVITSENKGSVLRAPFYLGKVKSPSKLVQLISIQIMQDFLVTRDSSAGSLCTAWKLDVVLKKARKVEIRIIFGSVYQN